MCLMANVILLDLFRKIKINNFACFGIYDYRLLVM
jgi:hypothetical protein